MIVIPGAARNLLALWNQRNKKQIPRAGKAPALGMTGIGHQNSYANLGDMRVDSTI